MDLVLHEDWRAFRCAHAATVGNTHRVGDSDAAAIGNARAVGAFAASTFKDPSAAAATNNAANATASNNYFFTRDAKQSMVHTVFPSDGPIFLFFGAETFGFSPEVRDPTWLSRHHHALSFAFHFGRVP